MPRRQIYMIQYFRAVLAVVLVVWHTGELHAAFANRLPILYGFLMLTGFLTFQSASSKEADPINYVGKRLIRLAPVYWIATLVVLAKVLFIRSAHGEITFQHFIDSMLFIPDFNALHEIFPILIPGWYLAYDVWLTVLLSTMLRLGVGVRAALIGTSAALLLACGMIFHPQDPIGYRATNQILSALLGGILLRWMLPAWRPSRWQAGAIALLGLALYWLPYDLAFAAEWPMLVTGLPTLIMVGGAIAFDRPGDKPIRWLAWLGDASMSIYIWHVVGIGVVGLILARLRVHDVVLADVLEVSGGLGLGAALYPDLERPLTAYLLEKFQGFRQPRPALPNA